MNIFIMAFTLKKCFKLDNIFNKLIYKIRNIYKDCESANYNDRDRYDIYKDIIDAIVRLEILYMYDNSNNSNIYTAIAKNSPDKEKILVVECPEMQISVQPKGDSIHIYIKRKQGRELISMIKYNKSVSENNISYSLLSDEDRMLNAIVECKIFNTFADVLEEFYYKVRKEYDIDYSFGLHNDNNTYINTYKSLVDSF